MDGCAEEIEAVYRRSRKPPFVFLANDLSVENRSAELDHNKCDQITLESITEKRLLPKRSLRDLAKRTFRLNDIKIRILPARMLAASAFVRFACKLSLKFTMNWTFLTIMLIVAVTDTVIVSLVIYALLRARTARLRWEYAEITWMSGQLRTLLSEVNPNPHWIEDANEKLANRKDFLYKYHYRGNEYSSSSLCFALFCSYDFNDLKLANEAMMLRRVLVDPAAPDDSVLVSRISGGVRALAICALILSAGVSVFSVLLGLHIIGCTDHSLFLFR